MDTPSNNRTRALLAMGVAAVVLWSYWSTLGALWNRWYTDPQYNHGFFVAIFSAYLLWRSRSELKTGVFRPRWWGVGLILVGAATRVASIIFYQPWLDAISLLPVLCGIAVSLGGRRALVWSAPAILFLVFMIPLPYGVQALLGSRLQRFASLASTFILQTLGIPAVTEGNVILLTESRLGIVEACNGLSMMMMFFALSTGCALIVRRSWVEKIVIVASAVPIAIVSNVTRITVTGFMQERNWHDIAGVVFHDIAGWLMMPFAIVLLILELRFLSKLVVVVGSKPKGFAFTTSVPSFPTGASPPSV